MYLDIYEAIENHHLLQFYYGNYFRIVEPHVYGKDSRGRDLLRGFQIAGADELGLHPGWKWFDTREMHHVIVLPTSFVAPRPNFHLGEIVLQKIYCQVPGSAHPYRPPAHHVHRS